MTDLKARLRRRVNKPDGSKRRPSPRELAAADRIEQLEAELLRATNEINAMKDALAQCQCE